MNIFEIIDNENSDEKITEAINRLDDINIKDYNGWTPLRYACYHGKLEIIKYLIKQGANVNIKNKDELLRISKEYPGKIYYLGKYYDNKFRVCLCNNKMIKNYIEPSQILLEKTPEMKEPGRFEADFNYLVLKLKDYIVKYTETIYAENGSIIRPKSYDTTNTKIFI